jgi:hypothetical protein
MQTKSTKISSHEKTFLLISAFKFLFGSKSKGTICPFHIPHLFPFAATKKKTEKAKLWYGVGSPMGQCSHLQGNFRPMIATRRQREVIATMVLQKNNGHEVVMGRTDTVTGAKARALPHRTERQLKENGWKFWFLLITR